MKHELTITPAGATTRGPYRGLYAAVCSCGLNHGLAHKPGHHHLRHEAHVEAEAGPKDLVLDVHGKHRPELHADRHDGKPRGKLSTFHDPDPALRAEDG